MPNYSTAVAAATAVVGFDLWDGQVWARSPVDRVLNTLGLAGSAVIGDTEVEVSIDEVRVGNFLNTALLVPQTDRDMADLGGLGVPAGAQLRAIVRDAPATSILHSRVNLENL